MEQELHLTGRRVDSTEVGAFVQVAAMASERKVFDIIAAPVLPREDMFYLVRHNAMLLEKLAVLATISRPVADQPTGASVHR